MMNDLLAARGHTLLAVLLLLLLAGAALWYQLQAVPTAAPTPAHPPKPDRDEAGFRGQAVAAATSVQDRPAAQPALHDVPHLDRRLSVIQAYAQIPHRRTAFGQEADPASAAAGMTRAERAYLKRLFAAVDQGVVLRVESTHTRLNHASMETRMTADRGYPDLLTFFEALTPPPRLAVAHRQLVTAVRLQQDFFNEWDSGSGTPDITHHPLVRAASDKLRGAYSALISSFPEASSHNRQAFFDHLCALDFI